MSNFRKEVHAGATSKESAFLITNTRRLGKNSHNELARRKWGGLYAKKFMYRRIILWRKIISKISFYNCDFEGFVG